MISSLRTGQTLAQVTVRSKHGGLRDFDPSHPAITRDAYETFNECVDAGFTPGWFPGPQSFAEWTKRLYVGDMNMYRDYTTYAGAQFSAQRSAFEGWSSGESYGGFYNYGGWMGRDSRDNYHGAGRFGGTVLDNEQYLSLRPDNSWSARYRWPDPADYVGGSYVADTYSRRGGGWSTSNIVAYSLTGLDVTTQSLNFLRSLRSVKLITDYAPRMEGSRRYWGANQPTVDIGLDPLTEGVRPTYRDRHFVLHGYDVSEEFYSPCYRQRPLPSLKDYRRTLYWNPDLQLDANGRADISFFNNSQKTSIVVEAEGMTGSGELLYDRQ